MTDHGARPAPAQGSPRPTRRRRLRERKRPDVAALCLWCKHPADDHDFEDGCLVLGCSCSDES